MYESYDLEPEEVTYNTVSIQNMRRRSTSFSISEAYRVETLKPSRDENILKPPIIGLRWVIALLGFFLYFNLFYHRNGFPVALVAMVNGTHEVTDSGTVSLNDTCVSKDVVGRHRNSLSSEYSGRGEYNWSTTEEGLSLGGFFWGFLITKLFASRISDILGQRVMVAVAVGVSGVLVFLTPLAAYLGPYVLAGNRFLIGACYGPPTSAIHSLLSAWAPRSELAFMANFAYAGSSAGGLVGLILTGWLQEKVGWRMSFWLGGAMNALFLPFWIILVRNSPKEHPWLSPYEKKLLDANSYVMTKKYVPWFKLLTSPYLHICIISHFARCYLDVVFTAEGPLFFSNKAWTITVAGDKTLYSSLQMGMELSTASYICAAHYLASTVLMMVFGKVSDLMIEKKWTSIIMTRKLFHILGCGVTALLTLCIVFAKCNLGIIIALWVVIGASCDGTGCSYFISPIDVAPNYAATFAGIMAAGNVGAAISPVITSFLLGMNDGWNKTFYVTAAINLVACVVYVAFMTAEPQPWNFDKEDEGVLCESKFQNQKFENKIPNPKLVEEHQI